MPESISPVLKDDLSDAISELESLGSLNERELLLNEFIKVKNDLEVIESRELFTKITNGPCVFKTVRIPYLGLNSDGKRDFFPIQISDDEFLIYSPPGIISLVNRDFVDVLNSNHVIVNEYKDFLSKQGGMPSFRRDFSIDCLVLCLTTNCNLGCVYCYARGGEKFEFMDWVTAKTAIDYAVRNCNKDLSLLFHGGGEPTLAFELLKKSYDYCKNECVKRGIRLSPNIGTNGLLSDEQIRFFRDNDFNVRVSLDGPLDIHNKQRPLKNGKPSYSIVRNSINKLLNAGVSLEVVATITNNSVSDLGEIVNHIKGLGVKNVLINPVTACGRCTTSNIDAPEPSDFINNYLSVFSSVSKSYDFLRLSNYYCGASGKNFIVTPLGFITSCIEVLDEGDPASDVFFYGKIHGNGVVINEENLNYLRNLTVSNKNACGECFCKWNCGGGCLHDAFRTNDSINYPNMDSCFITRELLVNVLKGLVGK